MNHPFAAQVTTAIFTKTKLLLYTLGGIGAFFLVLGLWGVQKDLRETRDADRVALARFVDSRAKFLGSRLLTSKLSASEHRAAADVHEELLRSSLPRFMQKAKRPLSLVWTKVKEHHCILGVIFFYDPRFARFWRAALALFDVIVILFAEAATFELVFPSGVCESLDGLGDGATCEDLRSPIFRDTKICVWDAFVDPRCRLKEPSDGAYDAAIRLTMVAISIALCIPVLKLAHYASKHYLCRDSVWEWRPSRWTRDEDARATFDDEANLARGDDRLFAALQRVLREGDDRARRASAKKSGSFKVASKDSLDAETFEFRVALEDADVTNFERAVLRVLPATMRAVVRQRVELTDALLDLKTGRHPGMTVVERTRMASDLAFLKRRLELQWGMYHVGSPGWEYVFASTAYRVLLHATREAVQIDVDLKTIEDPALKCLLIYHYCRYENLNDQERRILRRALNTTHTWTERGYDYLEPPVSAYVKWALVFALVASGLGCCYFLLLFGLGRDEETQEAWWADAMITLALILAVFEPVRIAVCHCTIPILIGGKIDHYHDPVRLRVPFRNHAPATASDLIRAEHLGAFEDVGLPVPTSLRSAKKAWATQVKEEDDDDEMFVDPLARTSRRRRQSAAAEDAKPEARCRRCLAWLSKRCARVRRVFEHRSLDVAKFEVEAPTAVEEVVWKVAQNAGDLGNATTVDPHHAAYNRYFRGTSPRWAPGYIHQLRLGLDWRPSKTYTSAIGSWAVFSIMHDDVQEMLIEEAFMALVLAASFGVDGVLGAFGDEGTTWGAILLAFALVLVPLVVALWVWNRAHHRSARTAEVERAKAKIAEPRVDALDDYVDDDYADLDDDFVLGRKAMPPTRVVVCERTGDDRFKRLFQSRKRRPDQPRKRRLPRPRVGSLILHKGRGSVWDGATATENDGALLLEADDGSAVELVYGPDTRATKKRYGDRTSALLLANCRIFDEKSERKLDVAFDCADDEARDEWHERFGYLLGTAAKEKHATYAAQTKAVQLVAKTVKVRPSVFDDAKRAARWRRTLVAVARDARRRRGRARRRWVVACRRVSGKIATDRREARGYTSAELAALPSELRRLSLEAKRANATAILKREGLLRHLAKTVETRVKGGKVLTVSDAVDLLLCGNCVRMLLALPGVLRAVLRKKVERKSLEAFLYLSATSRVPLITSAALEIMAALYLSRGPAKDAVDAVLLNVDKTFAKWGRPGLGFSSLPDAPEALGFDKVPKYGAVVHLLNGDELDDVRLSALSLCGALIADGRDRPAALWTQSLLFRAANGVLATSDDDLALADAARANDPRAAAPGLCGMRDDLLEAVDRGDASELRQILSGQLERFLDVWESRNLDDADEVDALPEGTADRIELLVERAKRRALLLGDAAIEDVLAAVGDDFTGLVRLRTATATGGEPRAVSADDAEDDSSGDDIDKEAERLEEERRLRNRRVDVTAAALTRLKPDLIYARVAEKKTKAERRADAAARRALKDHEALKAREAEAYIQAQRPAAAAAQQELQQRRRRPTLGRAESQREIDSAIKARKSLVAGGEDAAGGGGGGDDAVAPTDPRLEKFLKMVKMHVPLGAVEAKMRAEGLDPVELQYEKYRGMVRMHVPRGAVEAKMKSEGLDPAGVFGGAKRALARQADDDPSVCAPNRRREVPLGCARAPRVKLRGLWWDFVDDEAAGFWAADAKRRKQRKLGRPVWLDDEALDDLERVYGDARDLARKAEQADKPKVDKTKKRSILAEALGQKRGLELNILHGSLKVDSADAARRLKHLDRASARDEGGDKTDALAGLFGDAEVVDAVFAALQPFVSGAEDTKALDAPSLTFLQVLAQVPRASAKVRALQLQVKLNDRVRDAHATLDVFQGAADEVRASPSWREVMEFVLAVNNFANDGTHRGWKYAIKVSSLRKLRTTKTAAMEDLGDTKPGNLLRFVAKHVDVRDGLAAELKTVPAAAVAPPLPEVNADLVLLEQDHKAVQDEADALALEGDARTADRARLIADDAARALGTLKAKLAKATEACDNILRAFGEDPKKVPPEAFFADIASFLVDFKQEAQSVDEARATRGRRVSVKKRGDPSTRPSLGGRRGSRTGAEEQTFLAGIRHSLKRAGTLKLFADDDSEDDFDAATRRASLGDAGRSRSVVRRAMGGDDSSDVDSDSSGFSDF